MAVGFTPKHIEDLPLANLTQKQFIVLANDTAKKLKWNVGYLSENGLIAYTDNGMFSWNAEVKIKIENGVANIQSASTGSEMFDWGKNKKNVAKFITTFEEVKTTLTMEEVDAKYEELNEQIVPQEEDILKLPPATTSEQITDFLSIIKPTQGYFITPILLNINILIFILMAITGVNIMQPDNESLLDWGANFRPMTLEGEWWRLITNCFLHIGIIHLLLNMYALLNIGVLLEPLLGKTRFISAYLLSGITASIVSLWWHDLTISAGASGAIFGMYGVFLALLTTDLIEKAARKALLTSIAVFVVFNLINGIKGGIDNAAHIGGLLSGIAIGYALLPSLKRPENKKLSFGTIGLLSILILISSFIIYTKLPNDIGKYDAKMQEFSAMEEKALGYYNLPENTPKYQILREIKDKGIYYWKENIKLIESFNDLDLPIEIKNRNQLLNEYCELRIQSYEILYKSIPEDTDNYQTQLEECNKKIEAKLKEIENK